MDDSCVHEKRILKLVVFVAKKMSLKGVFLLERRAMSFNSPPTHNWVLLCVLLVCYNEIMTQFEKCLISFISINYVCPIYCAAFTPISQGWLNLTRREGWISFRSFLIVLKTAEITMNPHKPSAAVDALWMDWEMRGCIFCLKPQGGILATLNQGMCSDEWVGGCVCPEMQLLNLLLDF